MIAAAPPLPVRHARLRSGEAWPGVDLAGVEVAPDGSIELERVPAVEPPSLAAPGPAPHSGLALDDRCGLYVSDAAGDRVLRIALDCGERLVLSHAAEPGRPAGMSMGPRGWLLLADPGGARVLLFTRGLRLRGVWSDGLLGPRAVASNGRWVAVLDLRPDPHIVWLDSDGRPLRAEPEPGACALAADGDALFVGTANGVRRLDSGDGQGPPPARLLAGRPVSAVAAAGGVLFAADAESGEIQRLALPGGRALGPVAGYRGPVAALAAGRDGRLFIKPGDDDTWLAAAPRAARVIAGTLTAGPLDAGEDNVWARAAVAGDVPGGTTLRLETFGAGAPAAGTTWTPAAATDTLLTPHRYLWLRLTLEREPGTDSSPVVEQVKAQTPGGTYFEHLPAVYSRDPGSASAIEPLLALAQSAFDDLEERITDLGRFGDPVMAPAGALATLAAWQAFELPRRISAREQWDEARALIAELSELLPRRATPEGVVRLSDILAEVRPRLFELFRERRVWLLGQGAGLGFDTSLPAAAVDGIVVGDSRVGASGPEDPDAWGAALFADAAHLFTATAPAAAARGREAALRAALDAEKPAHTVYHLCLVEPRMRVGVQARLGLDAIVAGLDRGLELGEHGRLDFDGRTAASPGDASGAVGRGAHVGLETRIA